MRTYYHYFVLLLSLCFSANNYAQPAYSTYRLSKDDSLYNDFFYKEQYLMGERLNMLFPALGRRATIYQQVFDFDHINRPAVVMVGYADCPPCTVQLPVLIDYSNNAAFANMDFIYITYDDSVRVRKEIGKRAHNNLKICSMPRSYILNDEILAASLPTVYFINGRGITRRITQGGTTGVDAVRQLHYVWDKYLQLIATN